MSIKCFEDLRPSFELIDGVSLYLRMVMHANQQRTHIHDNVLGYRTAKDSRRRCTFFLCARIFGTVFFVLLLVLCCVHITLVTKYFEKTNHVGVPQFAGTFALRT